MKLLQTDVALLILPKRSHLRKPVEFFSWKVDVPESNKQAHFGQIWFIESLKMGYSQSKWHVVLSKKCRITSRLSL